MEISQKILHTSMINFFLLNLTFEEKILFLANTDFFNNVLKILNFININSGECYYDDMNNLGIDKIEVIAIIRILKDHNYIDVKEKYGHFVYTVSNLGINLIHELLYFTFESTEIAKFIKIIISDKINHNYFNKNSTQKSIFTDTQNQQLLNSELMRNSNNIIGLIGLNGSGKSYWMDKVFKLYSYVKNAMGNKDMSVAQLSFSTIFELEQYLENSKDLIFLAITGFGDSWDHKNIDKAFKILQNSNLKVVLEIHNTAAICQDYLHHSAYFLSKNKKEVPTVLQQNTDRELRVGHNLRKMFEADCFFNN